MLEAPAQHCGNRGQALPDILARPIGTLLLLDLSQIGLMLKKLRRKAFHRGDTIDQSRCRRAARHSRHRGFVEFRLGEREAAIFLDRFDSE